MFGSILGAFSGGINQVSFSSNHSINVGYHMAANCVGSLGTYLGQTAYMDGNLKNISIGGLLISAVGGASAGYLDNSVARSGFYNYISNQGAYFFDFVRKAKKLFQLG